MHGCFSWSVLTYVFVHSISLIAVLVVLVGEAHLWLPELIERAKALKISGGFERGTDLFVNSIHNRMVFN